jgi:hypothetical protein
MCCVPMCSMRRTSFTPQSTCAPRPCTTLTQHSMHHADHAACSVCTTHMQYLQEHRIWNLLLWVEQPLIRSATAPQALEGLPLQHLHLQGKRISRAWLLAPLLSHLTSFVADCQLPCTAEQITALFPVPTTRLSDLTLCFGHTTPHATTTSNYRAVSAIAGPLPNLTRLRLRTVSVSNLADAQLLRVHRCIDQATRLLQPLVRPPGKAHFHSAFTASCTAFCISQTHSPCES